MYVLVPEELQSMLVRDVKRSRLHSSLILYPVVVVLLSSALIAFILIRGHALYDMLKDALSGFIDEKSFLYSLISLIVVAVAMGVIWHLRDIYKACRIEEHPCCLSCKTLNDSGKRECPLCGKSLGDTRPFFYSPYKDEEKIFDRYGLERYSDG